MRNHEKILEIVQADTEPQKDLSLQGNARRRALETVVPRTLTPWEWQEWYAIHGVPESHRNPEAIESKPTMLERLKTWVRQYR